MGAQPLGSRNSRDLELGVCLGHLLQQVQGSAMVVVVGVAAVLFPGPHNSGVPGMLLLF